MKKKKIGLYIGVTPSWGGAYQYSLMLIDALAALPDNYFETVIVYTDKSLQKHLQKLSLRTVHITESFITLFMGIFLTCCGWIIFPWKKISHLIEPTCRIIKKECCDLWVFSSYSFMSYLAPCDSVGVIHDLMHRYEREFPEVSWWGTYYWRESVFKKVCKWAKVVLVDSEFGKRQILESYTVDDKKIQVLPFIAPRYTKIENIKENANISDKLPSKFIFYPAQFWKHKNHDKLIKAVAILKKKVPNIKLVLTGSPKNGYKSARSLVKKLSLEDDVLFLGFVGDSDLIELYKSARAMVMPTFFGPTNIPPLEAMKIGCPVAVSDIYGMPEQVGDAGLFFDPRSIDSIAGAIYKLWVDDNLCNKLINRGKQRSDEWGQSQFNRKFFSILSKILL